MKCPKCNIDQASEIECEACGVIFEKYYKLQEKNRVIAPAPGDHSTQRSSSIFTKRFNLIISVAVIIVLCIFGFWLALGLNKPKKTETVKTSDSTEENKLTGTAKQLYDYKRPQTNIEKAQVTTVFIKSPWGLGSGFFINEECDIITNKHVLKFDEEEVKNLQYQVEMLGKIIERDEKQIEEVEGRVSQLANDELIEDMNYRLQTARQKIETMKEEYENLHATFEKVQFGTDSIDYVVFLFDKSEHLVTETNFSDKYDLALIKINQEDCPYLNPIVARNIHTGQRVYTIGNPLGLSHTVTSGIISGQRMQDGIKYLQTDASINPGNSGGPLINDDGQVLGINTMILKDTEGIGFAIPIEIALQEFDLEFQ
jgi:S1-C subfamily serine protease